jgi:hypothetical protein
MPTPPAPSARDTFFFDDGKAGNSNAYGNSPRTDPDTFIVGNSEDQTIKPEPISVLQYPYAANYTSSIRITQNLDVPDAPFIVLADATSGNITITLPSAAWASGKTVTVMRYDNTANTVTIAAYEGNIRVTAAVSSILNTQYGTVDYTACSTFDGTTTDTIWIGR